MQSKVKPSKMGPKEAAMRAMREAKVASPKRQKVSAVAKKKSWRGR